jgi:hypothetical protein
MINPNPLANFMMWYVSEKEINLPVEIPRALNFAHHLQKEKKIDLFLAIDIAAKKYSVAKELLYTHHQKRKAYISASKKVYKKQKELDKIPEKLCDCGCGQSLKNKKNRFINGHNTSTRTLEQKKIYAKKMRDSKLDFSNTTVPLGSNTL